MKLKDKNIYSIPINLHKKRALLLTIVVISYCLFIPRIISFFEPQNIAESGFHKYKPIIIEMANIYNVPPDLVAAMIKTESDFRHNVVSSQGARGLMQVLPSTAKSLQITNLHDPKENIRAGTKYLKQLIVSDCRSASGAGLAVWRHVDNLWREPVWQERFELFKSLSQR